MGRGQLAVKRATGSGAAAGPEGRRPRLAVRSGAGRGSPPSQARGADRGRWDVEFPVLRILAEDGSADPGRVRMADAELLRLYRLMLLGRELGERMVTLQRQGRIGFYVGCVGEEASVLGAASAMEDRDWIFPSYREHLAALMRGMPLATFVCHLLGNSGDPARGRQMPCHETWRPGRYASVSSPLATQLPQAVGAAWAARLKGDDMVALAYLGDGTTSAHDFHTALNFAGVRRIPVVFVCRNNGWAISTPRELQTASATIAQKAVAYGIRGERVDGNDLLAVHDATRRARARASAGEGPTLLECVTYRLEGHSTSDDPRAYRPEELVAPWREKDPIVRMGLFLERRGLVSGGLGRRLRREVREEIQLAVERAEALAPAPPAESLFQDVYAVPLWQQRQQLEELRAAAETRPDPGGGPGGAAG